MATVPNGVIVAWPSTVASIPSGWTRETAMDGKYFQGSPAAADADLVTARGSANHTHTSPSHTPIQNSHTHTYTLDAAVGPVTTDPGTRTVAANGHVHHGQSSASATATNNGIAITVDATSNDLSFKEVIFIKSDGTPTGIPSNAYAFFASDTLPTGWTRVQGNTYLKGAAAAGNGGATGGSNTHTHTSPAHTHTQNSHSHGSATSNTNSPSANLSDVFGGTFVAESPHSHAVSLNATTATNQSVTTTIDSSSHEPVHKKLNVVNNGSGGDSLPDQIIALWGGTHAGIPTDWSRYTDMDGFFAKGANANGESAVTTGGATTHTHTAANCQPTQNSHTHTGTHGAPDALAVTDDFASVGGADGSDPSHTHVVTVSSATATNQSVAVIINANTAESAYPPYVRVIFIRFTAAAPVGGVYTSYLYDWAYAEIEGKKLEEVQHKIHQGDHRYMQEDSGVLT